MKDERIIRWAGRAGSAFGWGLGIAATGMVMIFFGIPIWIHWAEIIGSYWGVR